MFRPTPKSSHRHSVEHLPTNGSVMTHTQLIDSLTSHISLYHSSSSSPSANPNPRSSILKWYSSLSVNQRQAHITTVDRKFIQILFQMLAKVRKFGNGGFIILPDIPNHDLPTVCYKKSSGLLYRVAESNESERLIYDSARLFGSREGECIDESLCSVNCLDSMTMSEDFVENVNLFVETMDKVSNGEFLRGEESELGSDWVELSWLKAKGYYSFEAFVANRLELALRMAWLNSNNGKKKGVKLKEKLSTAGVAANAYWRKKGCVDWWEKLEGAVRTKVLTALLGKAAKPMTHQILKGVSMPPEDNSWLFSREVEKPLNSRYNNAVLSRRTIQTLSADAEFGSIITPTSLRGKPTFLDNIFNSLFVLQDITAMIFSCRQREYDKEKLFFSTLSSISTISDYILRILRGYLIVLSLDYTKHELLGGENHKNLPNKSKGNLGASSRRKKGKTRRMKKPNPAPMSSVDDCVNEKPLKELDLADGEKTDSVEYNKIADIPQGKEIDRKTSLSTVEMEQAHLIVVKDQIAERKNRKGKSRSKSSGLNNPIDIRNSDGSVTGSDNCQCSNSGIENQTTSSSFETLNCKVECELIPPAVPALLCVNVICNKDISLQNSVHISESDAKSDCSGKAVSTCDGEEKPSSVQDLERGNLHHTEATGSSSKRPGVASAYFPSVGSHLPAATDRLHLDVGFNWHNHFYRSFIPAMHQAIKTPVESGIMPRPLPMSLDWPPMVRSARGLAPSWTCNYDTAFVSRRRSTSQQGFTTHSVNLNGATTNEERKNSGDFMDFPDLANTKEISDECDSHCISEEEFEVHAVSGLDYNQYFGGGVMYWDPSDHPGTGFSRPPSLSSEDSSWAWREADMNRAVDDMVAFSSSYSTNGLTSPTAASFCSPFDPLGPGHKTLSYVIPGNEVSGKVLHSPSTLTDAAAEEDISGTLANLPADVEGQTGDSLPYHILRPIIIPSISRDRSRSEFKRNHDHKSPCIPPTRREQPRIKRPPSPVVLCVPRAPCPPPPSPVSDSRKHRGFPTVRSGSSSPRQWGLRGWYQDVTNSDEARMRMDGAEIVWPTWRNKNLSTRPMIQPLPAALLQDRLIAISQLARDQEHPDVVIPLQPAELQSCPTQKASHSLMHNLLHNEIDSFCKQVAAENLARKPDVNWAVKRVTRSLQVLWPRSRTNIFGSNATGLSLPTSDVDLVVCLPPVRNLEPIKEAGILEGRNGIKETCLQHAARYLANQEWVKNDSLKTVENTAIPIIMLAVEVPHDLVVSFATNMQSPKEGPTHVIGEQGNSVQSDTVSLEDSAFPKASVMNYESTKHSKSVRLDISFKSPSHTGIQTTELVKELTEQFPAVTPLALVLKQFLADRSLDQSYSGGLSSYCLVLLITRFLQHEHHLGRSINQNFGSLLMDFLYFFGNVFDPRQMRISVQGSGVYINRERGCSIDPIHIDDPLFPTNNVGRNCFRIHQCIKAFSEAYSILENELACLPGTEDTCSGPPYKLLPKIIPSINLS